MTVQEGIKVIVSKIIDEGCGVKTFRLDLDAGTEFGFSPGQGVRVSFPGTGRGRVYPISSSPLEKDYLEITAASSAGDEGSSYLSTLKGGETLIVSGPEGDAGYRDDIRHAVLVASGIWVSSFRSVIRYVLGKGLPNTLRLFYAERAPACILFRQELEDFSRNGVDVYLTLTGPISGDGPASWSGPTGPLTADIIRRRTPSFKESTVLLSGPASFVEEMLSGLMQSGLPRKSILAMRPEAG
jgi:NAD(P)H-flavin reductase